MPVLDPISNSELGISVRSKLNTILNFFNWNQELPERSFIGRKAGSTGVAERLSSAEAKAILELAIADIPTLQATLNSKANVVHTQAQSTIIGLVSDLADKASRIAPNLTGNARSDTPDLNDISRRIATTEFVAGKIAELIGSAPGVLDTLEEIAAALGDDPNFVTTIMEQLASKQDKHIVLTAMAALTLNNNKMIYFTGNDTAQVTDLTALARTLLARTTVAGMRDTLEIQNPIQTLRSSHTAKTPLTGTLTETNINEAIIHTIPANSFNTQFEKLTYKFLLKIDSVGAVTLGNIILTFRYNSVDMASVTIPSSTSDNTYLEWDIEVSGIALSSQRVRSETRLIAPSGIVTRHVTPRVVTSAATNVDVDVNLLGQLGNVSDTITLTDVEVYKNGLMEIT